MPLAPPLSPCPRLSPRARQRGRHACRRRNRGRRSGDSRGPPPRGDRSAAHAADLRRVGPPASAVWQGAPLRVERVLVAPPFVRQAQPEDKLAKGRRRSRSMPWNSSSWPLEPHRSWAPSGESQAGVSATARASPASRSTTTNRAASPGSGRRSSAGKAVTASARPRGLNGELSTKRGMHAGTRRVTCRNAQPAGVARIRFGQVHNRKQATR